MRAVPGKRRQPGGRLLLDDGLLPALLTDAFAGDLAERTGFLDVVRAGDFFEEAGTLAAVFATPARWGSIRVIRCPTFSLALTPSLFHPATLTGLTP